MRKLRLIKMKWAMSSSKWHDRYMAEMTLNSIFEVKPHAVSYDYSTYLWFFFLLVILQMTFTKHILFFFFFWEISYVHCSTDENQVYNLARALLVEKCLWFPSSPVSPVDQPTHMGIHLLVAGQCHVQQWKQNLTAKWCFLFEDSLS